VSTEKLVSTDAGRAAQVVAVVPESEVSAAPVVSSTGNVGSIVQTNLGPGRVVAEREAVVKDVVVDNATVARAHAALVPAEPAKPVEFFDDKHHHRKEHLKGHKAEVAVVATEQDLLDDIARYRGQLVNTIDELHTRLSPKYQIDQLKSNLALAGTDALSILKNEGSPVDETRKKRAESILKAGGAISGLMALHGLRKLAAKARTRHSVRKAVSKGLPKEHLEIVGVVEGVESGAAAAESLLESGELLETGFKHGHPDLEALEEFGADKALTFDNADYHIFGS